MVRIRPRPSNNRLLEALREATDNGLDSFNLHFERGRAGRWLASVRFTDGYGAMYFESGDDPETVLIEGLEAVKPLYQSRNKPKKRVVRRKRR